MLLLTGNISVKTNKSRWRGNKKKPFWLIRQLFFRKSMSTRKGLFFNPAVPPAKMSWLSYELWEMYHLYIALSTLSFTGKTVTDILVIWKNRTPCSLDLLWIQLWWIASLPYDTLQHNPCQCGVSLDQKKSLKGDMRRQVSFKEFFGLLYKKGFEK